MKKGNAAGILVRIASNTKGWFSAYGVTSQENA